MAPHQQISEPNISQTTTLTDTKEILYDGQLYDVSNFVHRHPGGDKIILKYTEPGEDATLAFQQFHNRSIDKCLKMLKTLPHRPEPPFEVSDEMKQVRTRNAEMTADFVQLYKELKEEGIFEPYIPHLIYRFVETVALRLLGYSLIMDTTGVWTQLAGGVILSISIGRGGWMHHEFGHLSGTGNPTVDRFLSSVFSGFSVGWSDNWWRRHHNNHHAMTNRVTHDPDVDLFPGFVVFSKYTMRDNKQDQTVIQRYQAYLAPIISVLLYFQWIYIKTTISVIRNKSVLEFTSLFSFHYTMYKIGFYMWLYTLALFAIYLYGNTSMSHTFVPTAVGPMHWIEYTFRGTVDIQPSLWCNWWMGYLNFQIEHHLFPTMPQFRSPLIKDRVKALAEKHGLPYHVYSYKDAVFKTLSNMQSISHFLQSID